MTSPSADLVTVEVGQYGDKLNESVAQVIDVTLEAKIDSLVKSGCKSDNQYIEFGETIADIDQKIKAINRISDQWQEPFRKSKKTVEDARKAIDKLFTEKTIYLYDLKQEIINEYHRFATEKKRLADEVEQERQAKLRAEEEERLKKLKDDVESDPFSNRPIDNKPVEIKTRKVVAPNVRTAKGTVSTSFLAALEITDKAAVPEQYKIVDEKALLSAYRGNKKLEVPGIRFYEKPVTSTRE